MTEHGEGRSDPAPTTTRPGEKRDCPDRCENRQRHEDASHEITQTEHPISPVNRQIYERERAHAAAAALFQKQVKFLTARLASDPPVFQVEEKRSPPDVA